MQFHAKKRIYLISRVFLPGLFKIYWHRDGMTHFKKNSAAPFNEKNNSKKLGEK